MSHWVSSYGLPAGGRHDHSDSEDRRELVRGDTQRQDWPLPRQLRQRHCPSPLDNPASGKSRGEQG